MVVSARSGTPYDTELDLDKLFEIAKYWEEVRIRGGYKRGVTSLTHMQVYSHQVPGGMISNLESQLSEQSALDRLPEVLAEIPVVRSEIGELARSEEDLLSYARFPQTARTYLERHHIGPEHDVFGTQMPAYLTSQAGAALGDDAGDRLRDILALVEESDIDEVVIEQGDLKMTVRKAGGVAAVPPEAAAAPAAADDHANGYHVVRSK